MTPNGDGHKQERGNEQTSIQTDTSQESNPDHQQPSLTPLTSPAQLDSAAAHSPSSNSSHDLVAAELSALLAAVPVGAMPSATQLARIEALQRKINQYQLQQMRIARKANQPEHTPTTPDTANPSTRKRARTSGDVCASDSRDSTPSKSVPPSDMPTSPVNTPTTNSHQRLNTTMTPTDMQKSDINQPNTNSDATTQVRVKRKYVRKAQPPSSKKTFVSAPSDQPDVLASIDIGMPPLYSSDSDSCDSPSRVSPFLSPSASPASSPSRLGQFRLLESQLQILAQTSRMHQRVLEIEDKRVVQYSAQVIHEQPPHTEPASNQLTTHTASSPPSHSSPCLVPDSRPVFPSSSARPLRPSCSAPVTLGVSTFAILSELCQTAEEVFTAADIQQYMTEERARKHTKTPE